MENLQAGDGDMRRQNIPPPSTLLSTHQHINTSIIMSKSKAAKRKRQAQAEPPQKHVKTTAAADTQSNGSELVPQSLHSVVSDEEIAITVETLEALAQHPALIKTKACRDLRTAVYDFRQASTTGMNTNGMSRALSSVQHATNIIVLQAQI